MLYLTVMLDGGGWSTPRPGRFNLGKETRYPHYRRLGGPQGRSGRKRKTLYIQNFLSNVHDNIHPLVILGGSGDRVWYNNQATG
jgi:hypothetical protein